MIRQKVIDNYRDMVASLKTELKLAEAEVERLTALLETHASTCVVCDYASKIAELQAENASLRKVVDAARVVVRQWEYVMDEEYHKNVLKQALAELDKEGER